MIYDKRQFMEELRSSLEGMVSLGSDSGEHELL